DEPTNDLDIETLTILEDYLDEFPGAVIAVSHDRYFLDKMAEKIFVFEGKGKIRQYTGNYSLFKENEIIDNEDNTPNDTSNKNRDKSDKTQDSKDDAKNEKKKALKFSFKEQKEFDEIDDIIAGLEEKIQEVE